MAGYGQSLGQALGQFAFGSNTQDATMKGMLAGAQANSFDATAKKGLAEALKAEAESRLLQQQEDARKPEAIFKNAVQQYGIPTDDAQAVESYFKTGQLGGRFAPSSDGMGPVTPQPDWARQLPALVRSIGTTNRALTLGDKNVENASKADARNREVMLSDDIIAGKLNRNIVSGAQAAIDGKPLFNSDSNGAVLDLFNGSLNESGGIAQGTIAVKKEQAGAQKANARQSDASAANSYASAAKTNQDRELGAKGVLVQTADGPVFADPRTGAGTSITINGAPVKGVRRTGEMSATLQKELVEADDIASIAEQTGKTLRNALKINDEAYSGFGATVRAKVRSNLPGKTPSADATIELNNMIGEQALSGMKAIFGGNPTEGERAILLDLQASADKRPQQRKAIIERGIKAADRRMALNQERAKSIRSGTYLSEGAKEVLDTSAPQAGPAKISNDADYAALPSGMEFIAPDGSRRRKP